jgi:lytic murein transglycosylase
MPHAPISIRIVMLAALLMVAGLVLTSGLSRADTAFDAWREALWPDAKAAGVSRSTFDAAFKGVSPDLSLPDLVRPGAPAPHQGDQAEFIRPPQAYLDRPFLARLAGQGRDLLAKYGKELAAIEARIGVEPQVVLAIWGRETAFGHHKLPHYAIRALATQAYLGRRKDMFRQELIHALKMLEDKVIAVASMRSSWAGAMGLTQFMPTEYYSTAVDLDGDGRKDIWGSVGDALASAANQLKLKGWITGLPWGFEVKVPSGAACNMEAHDNMRPLSEWEGLGFRPVSGGSFPPKHRDTRAYLLMPAGAFGPAFLVTENFITIRRYNTSDLYALFVANLSDRIRGGGDFVTPWSGIGQVPTRDIAEIQTRLKSAGAPISIIDGRIGSNTRGVIGRYQAARGLKVDCWPTPALLQHLRLAAPK